MGPVAVVAAHPDDETIGMGGQLAQLPQAHLIHVTDGAPRNGRDAAALGFDSRESYARARQAELRRAMALAAIDAQRLWWAGLVDQEASLDLAGLARRLAERLESLRAEAIVTHAYEGGHPDHDAAAFGVHAACRLLGGAGPQILEFTSYHAHRGGMAVFQFLPAPSAGSSRVIQLSPAERRRKQSMLAAFVSQQHVLQAFPVELERVREAPRYDFTRAPHAGRLYYEQFDWGMDGERWRALARQALETLGITGAI